MKTFFSVLAAILVAGAIFVTGLFFVSTLNGWENRKIGAVNLLTENRRAAIEILEESRDGSIAEISSALKMSMRRKEQDREILSTLQRILEEKPFFPLSSDEAKLLAGVKSELAAAEPKPKEKNQTDAGSIDYESPEVKRRAVEAAQTAVRHELLDPQSAKFDSPDKMHLSTRGGKLLVFGEVVVQTPHEINGYQLDASKKMHYGAIVDPETYAVEMATFNRTGGLNAETQVMRRLGFGTRDNP